MIKGLDLSHWNSFTAWDQYKSLGYSFLINKASEGTWFVDKTFEPNRLGAIQADVPFGGYHYWRMNEAPKPQAQKFFSVAGGKIDFPPFVDVEAYNNTGFSKAVYQNHLYALLNEVGNLFGRAPIIYTAYYFWRDSIGAPSWSNNFLLWDANYIDLKYKPLIPPNWITYTFWQYTANEIVLGKGYDSNVFNGSMEDLYKLANKELIHIPTLDERVASLEARVKALEERV